MRIALLTEIPAPYRIPLFNALGTTDGVELEVLFLAERDPRRQYPVYEHEFRFDRRVLSGTGALARGRWVVLSRGTHRELDRSIPTSCCSAAGTSRPSGRACAGRATTAGRSCSGSRARSTTSAAARSSSSA